MNNVSKGITSNLRTVFCGAVQDVAASGTDAVAVTGQTIDTQISLTAKGGQSQNIIGRAGAIKFVLSGQTTLANTKTLSVAVEYQTSDDGSTWNTAVALRASSVWKTADSSTTFYLDPLEYDLSLESMPRYFRGNFTPDLNASGTDTATLQLNAILAECSVNPITRSAI